MGTSPSPSTVRRNKRRRDRKVVGLFGAGVPVEAIAKSLPPSGLEVTPEWLVWE